MNSHYIGLICLSILCFTSQLQAQMDTTKTKHTVEITAEKMPDGSTRYHSRVMHDPQNKTQEHDKSVESLFTYTPEECSKDPNNCRELKDFLNSIRPYKAPGFVD